MPHPPISIFIISNIPSLENPCMNHLPWMLERGTAPGTSTEPCGHALMASCPPEPFADLSPDIPFGLPQHSQQHSHSHSHSHSHGGQSHSHGDNSGGGTGGGTGGGGNGTWQLSKGDLATLLDLSKRLNLEGEITPVMAWGMVLAHPRLGEMRGEDFARLAEELGGKVRCYGYVFFFFPVFFFFLAPLLMLTVGRFGAVMEEFEVRDALENVFSMRPDFGMGY